MDGLTYQWLNGDLLAVRADSPLEAGRTEGLPEGGWTNGPMEENRTVAVPGGARRNA